MYNKKRRNQNYFDLKEGAAFKDRNADGYCQLAHPEDLQP